MKKIKKLTFKKQDLVNLTRDEQKIILGGNDAPTYTYCTDGCDGFTYGPDNCTRGCTGADCTVSFVGGGNCDPASGMGNTGCYVSLMDLCHTDKNCTYAHCTQDCPKSYGDVTCDKNVKTCNGCTK